MMIALEIFLEKIGRIENPKEYLKINPIKNLVLGNIQPSYAGLSQKINDYKYYLNQTGLFQKIQSLKSQIKHTHLLSDNLGLQKSKLEQEIIINKKDVDRNRQLNEEGVIPDNDLEKIETQYLQYQRQLDAMESQIVRNDITIEQLNTQILDLSQNRKDGRSGRELSIQQDVQRMKSEIETWKKTYLIIAPIAGKISFSKIWNEQQFVNASEEVLTIVPIEGVGEIIGKALLPIANSGKVKIGQMANIRLDGFPFQEYGVIKSTVKSISLVPKEENYLLEIELPDSLITTYDKVIPFRQEMRGTANIITEDRRILERIFDRVNSILKN
jgi:HlyD family secretion protein